MIDRPSESDLIDEVDEFDTPIGTMRRDVARAEGRNFRVAHIFIFDGKGRLLLQQLGTERTEQPCRWGSSVAAHVLAGESYEHAARRRLQAELLIDVPLAWVLKIDIREGQSVKFVTLFEGHADSVHIGEPDHTAALEFKEIGYVREALEADRSRFTDTFRTLFKVRGQRQ
jgi:hypothetical protein